MTRPPDQQPRQVSLRHHHPSPPLLLILDRYVVLGNGYRSSSESVSALRHVDEGVNVRLVSLDVLVLNEPLDLFLDHFLLREEHVLEDLHQLGLQLSVCDLLTHLHDLNDGLLKCCSRKKPRIKPKVHLEHSDKC